jgi:hypothetical protein
MINDTSTSTDEVLTDPDLSFDIADEGILLASVLGIHLG